MLDVTPRLLDDWGYGPSLWTPQKTGTDCHVERMRKISNIRGAPRKYSRTRSDTVLSSISWQEVESNETNKRKRAETILSTITSAGAEVDFLCSSLPYDTLADMMTSQEESKSGNVSVYIYKT